jgi:hypothetical protein
MDYIALTVLFLLTLRERLPNQQSAAYTWQFPATPEPPRCQRPRELQNAITGSV